MKVVLFGATGMVGQGALRECLLNPEITSVVSIVRAPSGQTHPKLREIVHRDFLDYSAMEDQLTGLDACFFCLGVASFGMSEEQYRVITHDYTLAAAKTLVRLNPQMVFEYVSGSGTNAASRTMWARVKGTTENELLALGFRAAYMLRPGFIVPLHGIRSKTRLYRLFYAPMTPILPLLERLFPRQITTTEKLGRAMIRAARDGAPKQVLGTEDISRL